jgi:hypothetical protein
VGGRQIVFGGSIAALGVASFAVGSWAVGVPLVVFGGLVGGLGVIVRVSGDAVPAVNTAFNALLQGRVAEAEGILDRAEGRWQLGYIRRVIDLQRASIAMRRGDLEGALVRAEAALVRRSGILTRGQEHSHVVGARAVRALIRASLGDVEGARADAAVVRGLPDAPPEALARAEVAEAIALERSGDREALAAHLAQKRTLLLDYTMPRERALVRAYQRMLKAPRTSVYRRGASRDAEAPRDGEPSVADWVARVAPAAAPFAQARIARRDEAGAAPKAALPIEAAAPPGLLRVAEQRLKPQGAKSSARYRAKLAALWVLVVVLFVSVWQLLSGEPGMRAEGHSTLGTLLAVGPEALGATLAVLLVAFLAALIARNLKHDRRLATALGALARGDAGAPAELAALARSPHAAAAAQAELQLARLAGRSADFTTALKHCDQGIAVATARESTRAMLASILLPDLVAERAFLLAVTDRAEKARAEMSILARQFPAYPFSARANLRVALVLRARRGDLEGAAELLAATTDDLPLSHRDETLADLVRAVAWPDATGAGERERLKEELRVDPELRAWLQAVALPVLRAFEAPVTATAPQQPRGEAEAEAEAERDAAAAEQEATGEGERRASPMLPWPS